MRHYFVILHGTNSVKDVYLLCDLVSRESDIYSIVHLCDN